MAVESFAAATRLRGQVNVPGDKSISHRALILASLADGASQVRGLASGADVASTAACLRQLGVAVEPTGPAGEVTVRPSRGGLRPPAGPLDVGNSGTTMRLLAGVLAGQPFRSRLTGDQSIRRRPMARVTRPLRAMGAQVRAGEGAAGAPGGGAAEETAPLEILGPRPYGCLSARTHRLAVASAQVKSCLLLAGLHAAGRTVVVEPTPSRDHTERMLGLFGLRVSREGDTLAIEGDGRPRLGPCSIDIPGDFSSAAFWIVAGLLVPASVIRLPRVGVNPTRTGLLAALGRMGAGEAVKLEARTPSGEGGPGEPVADITVRGLSGALRATRVPAAELPALIDEVPILAVAATQAQGMTVIEGAGELRVKESDRLAALASELGRMGAKVGIEGDSLLVSGPTPLCPARVSAHGDHRMAMALAVAGLLADLGPGAGRARGRSVAEVEGFEAAGVSYPGFRRDLEELLA